MRELLLQNPDLRDTQRSRQQQPSGKSQLSLIEKEAIRWKGKPWLDSSPVRPRTFRGTFSGPRIVVSTIPKGRFGFSLPHASLLVSYHSLGLVLRQG